MIFPFSSLIAVYALSGFLKFTNAVPMLSFVSLDLATLAYTISPYVSIISFSSPLYIYFPMPLSIMQVVLGFNEEEFLSLDGRNGETDITASLIL